MASRRSATQPRLCLKLHDTTCFNDTARTTTPISEAICYSLVSFDFSQAAEQAKEERKWSLRCTASRTVRLQAGHECFCRQYFPFKRRRNRRSALYWPPVTRPRRWASAADTAISKAIGYDFVVSFMVHRRRYVRIPDTQAFRLHGFPFYTSPKLQLRREILLGECNSSSFLGRKSRNASPRSVNANLCLRRRGLGSPAWLCGRILDCHALLLGSNPARSRKTFCALFFFLFVCDI